jgi:hypothetical protein
VFHHMGIITAALLLTVIGLQLLHRRRRDPHET